MHDADIANRRYYALMILGVVLPLLPYPFLTLIFISKDQSLVYRFICSRFLIWGIVAIMFLYAKYAEVQQFFLWPERKYGMWMYLGLFGILVCCYMGAGMISRIPWYLGMHENNSVINSHASMMKQYPVLLVFTCITAGVTEEFIFRGYMISRLSLFFKNENLPVIISAMLFAAMHLGYKTWSEVLFAFMIGLTFGYHYQKYRSLGVLIVMHFLIDFVALWFYKVHK